MSGPEAKQATPKPSPPTPTTPTPDDVEQAFHGPAGDHRKLVDTRWQLDYLQSLDGTREGKVGPRSASSALFVDNLRIVPRDPTGGDTSAYERSIQGVALALSGAAHLGSYPLPQGLGGTGSASVAYGTRPNFAFTITTRDAEVAGVAKAQHAQLVDRLTRGLDDFVEPGEAQRVLDQLLQQQFPGKAVTGTIVSSRPPTKTQVTTSLDYAPLKGPRLFELGLEIPTTTDKETRTDTVTRSDERVTGSEDTTTEGHQSDTTSTAEITKKHVATMQSIIKSGFKDLYQQVRKTGISTKGTLSDTVAKDSAETRNLGLNAEVKGNATVDLSHLPFVGTIVGKVLTGGLNFALHPNLSISTGLTTKNVDGMTLEFNVDRDLTKLNEITSALDSSFDNIISNQWETKITSAVQLTTSGSNAKKSNNGDKSGGSSTSTVTRGTVVTLQNGPLRLVEKPR
ncbi:MAG: hypothetical protein NT062_16990 [Proteobacteria bacterium]|nr:hypothetical protein [Pseudomonadota bacterium]